MGLEQFQTTKKPASLMAMAGFILVLQEPGLPGYAEVVASVIATICAGGGIE